ncbi:lytic transglycosylase domain-containing protein [Azoarcus sp. KH32C]|uniref:lytic transglycosylase domain-containing protein n=1 Tax=Azoarcus sp. KH32C TaxID=748247 RepID=UPI0002386FBA|nr:lytic transglycosylase domain-containing protein [Azoarcus sp. KH32C]BAL23423.1 soluble lytic murein transglycosylase precursor [Azoarcus sp. KH32C]
MTLSSCIRARVVAPLRVLASILAILGAHAAHAQQLYAFVDDQGISHFSDAPSDPRHRAIPGTRFQPSTAPRILPEAPRMRGTPEAISRVIHDTARETGVHPALLEAVASVESGFNERARSPKGALGVMQLMPQTASRFGVNDPFDLRQNISGGARYLRELIDRFNTLPLALAAYNAGEGAVSRYGNTVPPYPETRAYVPKVLDRFQRRVNAQSRSSQEMRP